MASTPAASSARAISVTSWRPYRWRMACIPSRSVTSWMYTAGPLTARPPPGAEPLPDPQGSRGHDVKVAGVGREVVAGAGDFEENRDLPAGGGRKIGAERVERVVITEAGDLHRLLEPVARYVGGDVGHHRLDRLPDGVVVDVVHEAQDGIAHDESRLGRIQNDDRLAALRSPDPLERTGGRDSELVDVGSRARPGGAGGDRGDDLGVADRCDGGHGGDDRNRRLPTAGHHVDVALIEVFFEVHCRDDVGPDCGRRQVDEPFAVLPENPVVGD